MKRTGMTFLVACMLLLAHTGFSQVNMESLVLSQPQSQMDIIGNTRAMLIDAFVQNDRQKVQELHRYLSENFDTDNYVTLFPIEKMLLFAWSGDFEKMLQYVKEADSAYIAQTETKIMPVSTNNFYQTLIKRVQQESNAILDNLQATSLTQEEKDFATLYLHYYLITDENYDVIVPVINANTRKFIEAYPDSEYMKLLYSYELRPANWGWGFGVSFGYSAKTGYFSKSFGKNDGAMDFYIDIAYKKTMVTMGFLGAFGRVRQEIILDDLVLSKSVSASTINPYLSFGYRFFEDRRLMVIPIAGIGTAFINPGTTDDRKNNPVLKRFDYSYGLTTHFGIMTDIKLGKIKRVPGQNFSYPHLCAVRVSYKFSYNTLKSEHIPIYYNGNIHTITAGIYFFVREIKHVKYK